MVERIIVGNFNTNTYIYSLDRKNCLLIDPGTDVAVIETKLRRVNMKPRGIALTHGHLDHIAGSGQIIKIYTDEERNVSLAIHKNDLPFLGAESREKHEEMFRELNEGDEGLALFYEMWTPLPEPDLLFEEEDFLLDSSLQVIHVPGHTEGSVCFYSEKEKIIFSGDTLMYNEIGQYQGDDRKRFISMLEKKIFTLPGDTRVFPGHGPLTTLERIQKEMYR